MNEQEFLKAADHKAWERFTSGNAGWDYVIITSSNASQAEGFRAQIQERLNTGFLKKEIHYGIVPDPEGERVGNGGAVLGAIRYISQREKNFQGLKVLVILSSGDSRRVAQYSAIGKIFSPVPRTLPNGRTSTLFDEAMIALSPIPDQIKEGMLVISGDVMLAFDASEFNADNADAAAIAFPEPAETGAGHGVFLSNEAGNIAKVWHKQKPEVLKSFGAVDEDGNVNIDTGAVFFAPKVVDALFTLICDEKGQCTDESFHRVVNGYLAPSLYVDFFYPLAEESTFEGYLKEVPEGQMSEDLLTLRKEIWYQLRPFRINLQTFKPSRFIHFGSTADVEKLMSDGIGEYSYLGWKRQIASCVNDQNVAAYNSYATGNFGKNVYLEDCIIENTEIGDNSILSGVKVAGKKIPSQIVLHCLKQTNSSYVTRIYGIHDNPKAPQAQLFAKVMNLGDVWNGAEHNLWNAKIYPACATMEESIDAALNLYQIMHGKGDIDAWRYSRKESLFSSFCKADGAAIQQWQQIVSEQVKQGQASL